MNTIERAITYIARFDPKFRDQIAGAPIAEIDRVQNLLGAPIPPVHRQFLLRMGASTDWVSLRQADFSVQALIRHLEQAPWRPPPGFHLIGVDEGEARCHVYLKGAEKDEEMAVVSLPDLDKSEVREIDNWTTAEAGSLAEMLCRPAFQIFRLSKCACEETRIMFKRKEGVLDVADEVGRGLGFELLWYSNSYRKYFEKPGVAFVAGSPPGFALSVKVAADRASDVQEVWEALGNKLDLVPYNKPT